MLATGPFAIAMRVRHGIDVSRWTEADAVALYSEETHLDDRVIPGSYPPEDTGSAGIYACKATRARGWHGVVRPGGQVDGGHQVCFDGVDPARKLTRFANSWGQSWGPIGGWGWMSFADLDTLLRDGGDAVTVTV